MKYERGYVYISFRGRHDCSPNLELKVERDKWLVIKFFVIVHTHTHILHIHIKTIVRNEHENEIGFHAKIMDRISVSKAASSKLPSCDGSVLAAYVIVSPGANRV